MSKPRSPRRKLCLGCGYVLDGLKEHTCPECGREFDVKNGKTFRWDPPLSRINNAWFVAAIYLLPQVLTLILVWIYFGVKSNKSIEEILMVWMMLSNAPLMWMVFLLSNVPTSPSLIALVGLVWWSALLTLICGTRLRNYSYAQHMIYSMSWLLLSGCSTALGFAVLVGRPWYWFCRSTHPQLFVQSSTTSPIYYPADSWRPILAI